MLKQPISEYGSRYLADGRPVRVMKFDGSSVATVGRVGQVARRIVKAHEAGFAVCAVISAMGETTHNLLEMASAICQDPPGRELDMLLTSGERIAMSLLAMAVTAEGVAAKSFTGSQAGIITDDMHGRARILEVEPVRVREALEEGTIAIVAGFQGVSREGGDITTLGRGGSDATAVAMAVALDAAMCEIYTDVDGIFTADPRVVGTASHVRSVSYEEMLEMTSAGANVLMPRCVEYSRRYGMLVHVRSSFSDKDGTLVLDEPRGEGVEASLVYGVAHNRDEVKVTVVGVPDRPGAAAALFEAVADAAINVDMIVHNVSVGHTGLADISFTVTGENGTEVMRSLTEAKSIIGFDDLVFDAAIGKVSLVGAGMKSDPNVSASLFEAIAGEDINIEMISTSEFRIAAVVAVDRLDDAVRAVHSAFNLAAAGGDSIVGAGTGCGQQPDTWMPGLKPQGGKRR